MQKYMSMKFLLNKISNHNREAYYPNLKFHGQLLSKLSRKNIIVLSGKSQLELTFIVCQTKQ
jgi:hypothetical protein